MSPLSLFWIEGCGQIPYAMNWGDGFVVDDRIIREHGITDPKPFFDAVLDKPYRELVVLSPHYYPPSISLQHNKQVPSFPLLNSLNLATYKFCLQDESVVRSMVCNVQCFLACIFGSRCAPVRVGCAQFHRCGAFHKNAEQLWLGHCWPWLQEQDLPCCRRRDRLFLFNGKSSCPPSHGIFTASLGREPKKYTTEPGSL